jgi:hypothetical protein
MDQKSSLSANEIAITTIEYCGFDLGYSLSGPSWWILIPLSSLSSSSVSYGVDGI